MRGISEEVMMYCLFVCTTKNALNLNPFVSHLVPARSKPAALKSESKQAVKLEPFIPLNDQQLLNLYQAIDLSG